MQWPLGLSLHTRGGSHICGWQWHRENITSLLLKVSVANSSQKQAKKVAALSSPLLSIKSSGATATAKVALLQ